MHIALGDNYSSYNTALELIELETLEDRRTNLCRKFAVKAAQHPKHRTWFKLNEGKEHTRSKKDQYKVPAARLARFENSPIPYLNTT